MNLNCMSDEFQLVTRSVAFRISQANDLEVKKPSLRSVDETALMRIAQWHNVLPWLSLYVQHFELGPANFRKKLHALSALNRAVGEVQGGEIVRVSAALTEQGINHLFFKGATVTQLFYQGFVDSRYSDDIDILISHTDMPEASQLIEGLGYLGKKQKQLLKIGQIVQSHPGWYRWRDYSFVSADDTAHHSKQSIDLHWRIADSFTFPIETAELLEKSSSCMIHGQGIPCLPFSLLFVYVCVHGHIDYFFRLRYLVDVYTAMQQADFDQREVMLIATNLGVAQKVTDAIATAEKFFAQSDSANAYANKVLGRYYAANGFPPRSHPNRRHWTMHDKRRYLVNQIRSRSSNCKWYEPLIARCKYNEAMANGLPEGTSPLVWYPVALIKRMLG